MNNTFSLEIEETRGTCRAGEKAAEQFRAENRIPVLSCEGACIRGEIARLAANQLAKESGYARACHGELLTVPNSGMAGWVKSAPRVVVIDGCFLRCQGRMLDHLLSTDRLLPFDAQSCYRKYSDLFDIDSVPESERREAAELVVEFIRKGAKDGDTPQPLNSCGSCG